MSIRLGDIVAIAGLAAGAAVGGPLGAAIGIGATILGGIISPQKVTKGAPLQDRQVNSSLVGRPLPIVLGTYLKDESGWIYQVKDSSGQNIVTRTSTKRSGLFTKVKTIKNVSLGYSRVVCEGPATVLKMWYGDEQVYNVADTGPVISDAVILEGNIGRFGFLDGSNPGEVVDRETEVFGAFEPTYVGVCREVVFNIYLDRWGGIPQARYLVSANTTDAFLIEQVDEDTLPGEHTSTDLAFWYMDRRHFISITDGVGHTRLIRWDSLTRTRLYKEISPEFDLVGTISPFDDFIFSERLTGSFRELYKVDPETLNIVARSAPGITGGPFQLLGFGGTAGIPRLFYMNSTTMHVFNPNVIVGSVFDSSYDRTLLTFQFIASFAILDYLGSTAIADAGAADGDGNFWVAFDETGETEETLVRFDAASGQPVENYMLTDIGDGTITNIGYDPGTNSIFGRGIRNSDAKEVIWKFLLDTKSMAATEYEEVGTWSLAESTFLNTPVNSRIYIKVGTFFVEVIDLTTMTLDRTLDLQDWSIPTGDSDYSLFLYDETQNALVSSEDDASSHVMTWVYLDLVAAGNTSVKLMTEFLGERTGLTLATDLDASAGTTQTFPGYLIDSQRPAANDAAEINNLFLNSVRPHDGKIQLKLRGTGIDKVLDVDTLGAVPHDTERVPHFRETALSSRDEIPSNYVIAYADPDKDYDIRTQSKRRDTATVLSEDTVTFTTAAALTAQQASDYVTRLEAIASNGLNEIETSSTLANLEVEVGDTTQFTHPDNGTTVTGLWEQANLTADGLYEVVMKREYLEVYGYTGTPQLWTESLSQIIIQAASFFNVLDIPHIEVGNQTLALYPISGGTTVGRWDGQDIGESPDGNEDYMSFYSIDSADAGSLGTLQASLDPGVMFTFDNDNTIEVLFETHTPTTKTEAEVLALNSNGPYVNGLLIEADDGTYETVVVQTWVDNGDKTFTGTKLLRGLSNTEESMNAGHASGRRVYVIQASLESQEIPVGWLDLARFFQGVLALSDRLTGVKSINPILGESQKPYPVREIEGSVDGSDNWDLTFRRQGRNMGSSLSFSIVPQGVTALDFVARIWDGPTLIRTITPTGTTPSGTSTMTVDEADTSGIQTLEYTAADQNTDFGGGSAPLRSIDIEIVQIDENGNEGPSRRVFTLGDPHWDSVVLLVWGNGDDGATAIPDRSDTPHSLTANGNVTLTTGTKKFGSAAIDCPGGTGDNVTAPASTDWDLGTADFTAEAWLNTTTSAVQGILSRGNATATSRWSFWMNDALRLTHNASNILVGTTDLSNTGWRHVAVSRNSGTTRMFIDGVLEISSTTVFDVTADAVETLRIGDDEISAGREFLGQIDDLRITKGIGRYPSDFTPPTAELPADV